MRIDEKPARGLHGARGTAALPGPPRRGGVGRTGTDLVSGRVERGVEGRQSCIIRCCSSSHVIESNKGL